MAWSMSIQKRFSEVPEKLAAAARRYCARHDVEAPKDDLAAVTAAEEHAYADPEARDLIASWERAKGRALGLPARSTSLYWPPSDARYVLYAGTSE